jgi:methylenetetrahydrofolate dehydrogenase (NADP+)/methenyltetrahydrofolate cyclohydrolase
MPASIIDGKAIAAGLRAEIAAQTKALPRPPGLAAILIGDDPASAVYVASKVKACAEVGFLSFVHRLPASTGEAELFDLIEKLNRTPEVSGILLQLPLPPGLDDRQFICMIDAEKDVDGLSPVNYGLLAAGLPASVPCTPLGCLHLIRTVTTDLQGKRALVLGRSTLVGKPMAELLVQQDCTVTVAHSKSADLPALCREADILVAAVGRPGLVRGSWIKPGAIVIDVGITRGADNKLHGDVAFAEALEVAGAITPVPGGVGPMTIACLLFNTLAAACRQQGVAMPEGLCSHDYSLRTDAAGRQTHGHGPRHGAAGRCSLA